MLPNTSPVTRGFQVLILIIYLRIWKIKVGHWSTNSILGVLTCKWTFLQQKNNINGHIKSTNNIFLTYVIKERGVYNTCWISSLSKYWMSFERDTRSRNNY